MEINNCEIIKSLAEEVRINKKYSNMYVKHSPMQILTTLLNPLSASTNLLSVGVYF